MLVGDHFPLCCVYSPLSGRQDKHLELPSLELPGKLQPADNERREKFNSHLSPLTSHLSPLTSHL